MTLRYRLYVDESGDHSFQEIDEPAKRYLGLMGVLVESEVYRTSFYPALEALKQEHFPHGPDDPLVLHRKELIEAQGSFWRLRDPEKRERFNKDLLAFLERQQYHLICVVIDKLTQIAHYGNLAFHPYHLGLVVMLERYLGVLRHWSAQGDVMAESRGKKEDRLLGNVYQHIYENGSLGCVREVVQQVLTTKELKLKPKTANIAGLQIADLLAYPCKQAVLCANGQMPEPDDFGAAMHRVVISKYVRHFGNDQIKGYGQVFWPWK